MLDSLKNTDQKIHSAISDELKRQREGIEMIASENFVSKAVLEAMGTPLTNKYSEGYPKKRYYSGNEFIDQCETLAIDRAKELFGAEHANVQPHAGSQANMESYFALCNLKDKILGMRLDQGGHLTHGSNVNFSGKFYTFFNYGVDPKTGYLDMDEVRKMAEHIKPKVLLSGFSAYPRKLDFQEFEDIAKDVGAYHMADIAHIAGLCATGHHQNPVPFCDVVTTTTHKTLRGPRGAMIMCKTEDRLKPKSKKNLAQKIDSAVFPGMQGGPLDHMVAAKAVAFKEALQPNFKEYCAQIIKNAKALAESLMDNGIDLVTEGTDNHLLLIDLRSTGLKGKQAETLLDEIGIYTNKNMIPDDPGTPFNPTGIRLGTPALTTRGMKTEEMDMIGEFISKALKNPNDENTHQNIRSEIKELLKRFPLYEELNY